MLLYLTPYKAEGRLLPLTNTTFIDVDACQNPITHFTKYYLYDLDYPIRTQTDATVITNAITKDKGWLHPQPDSND